VIIIVAAILGGLYFLGGPLALSFTIGTSTNVGAAGSPVTFTVFPSVSGATISSVVWNFGDGNTATTSSASTSHTYANGGHYLVEAQVTASYINLLHSYTTTVTNNLALFPLEIQANLSPALATNASVPTINFDVTKNAKAPVFQTGETVYAFGGYLEQPANSSLWTIDRYTWDFGNGQKQTVAADPTNNYLPAQNITTSYSSPGLYPMKLTLTTNSSTGLPPVNVTTIQTVAITSTSSPFGILTVSGNVLNPNVITAAEVVPGGPSSFDPQIDYETVGFEVISNVFQTLVMYNGSQTASFIPVVAQALPTTANGGISPDQKTYNFTIRSGLTFSNGDPLTAYDVWFSIVRGIAFTAGAPGTPDWIQAQFLIPGVQNGTATVYADNGYVNASSSVTYSNTTNTVAFHFNRPMTPSLVFQVLGDPLGAGIVDAKYACSVGACFSKNPSGYSSYMSQGNGGSYNTKMQWSPIGSGPYMVQSYVPGQSVDLVPNPHYTPVPGIPAAKQSVVIDWVKTPDTALLMLEDGQADSAAEIPPSDFPAIVKMQSQGLVHIYNFPSINVFFYTFNININKSMETTQFGSGFTEPSNYFADLHTRLAWINAFDYSGYLNNILGNAKYGATFGVGYQGIIPNGMILYTPPDQLGGLPTQNLAFAKGNFSESAWSTLNVKVPIVVPSGDPVELAAAQELAGTMNSISNGKITAVPVQIPFAQQIADSVPGQDPMGIYYLGWIADYPDPADYVNAMYALGGTYPNANYWVATSSGNSFAPTTTPGACSSSGCAPTTGSQMITVNGTTVPQDVVYNWLNNNATQAATSTNLAVRQTDYKITEELAIDLGLFIYVQQQYIFWYFRSYLHGNGPIGSANFPSAQENPMIGAGGDLLYFWLAKG
jgi:peptide/nickel transport system substrate-binding protein